MRICLFTSTFLPKIGGHEIAMDELAKQLTAMGHDVLVLAQTGSRWRRRERLDRPYQIEWFSKPFSQKWAIGKFGRVLKRSFSRKPFDLVHTFSSYPTGYAAMELQKQQGVPLIVTSQGGDLAEGSRYENRPVVMSAIRQTLRECSAVTNIGQYMRERALAIEPGCAGHLHDIPNGVDIAAVTAPVIDPAAALFPVDQPFILFMGRLHPRKGIDVLIKAFAMAADAIKPALLVIAGGGREEASLKALAIRGGVHERIRFLGPVKGEPKRWLLQNAACVVAPTRTWEGMPVVVLEALAAGRPVIGSNVGGIVDLVKPGVNGMLVPREDPAALAVALVKMMGDPIERDRLGHGSRDTARSYDWQKVAGQYVELYEKLGVKIVMREKSEFR